MSNTRFLIPAVIVSLFAVTASAESMRCGSQVITEGTTKFEVIEHCGEPDHKEGNRWYHKHGGQNSVYVVHFEGDSVSILKKERS